MTGTTGAAFPPILASRMSSRIRVVIADDHPAFRHALCQVIDAQPDMTVVAAVGDGVAALDAIRRLAPTVAVLDVRMPELDGIEVARQLAADQVPARTVIVTMHSERVVFERALAAGANGYLPKDTALLDVVDAVRTVARGEMYVRDAT